MLDPLLFTHVRDSVVTDTEKFMLSRDRQRRTDRMSSADFGDAALFICAET